VTSSQPIGIFDSGMGGLTVAHAISTLLPQESFVYYGDTKHLPYGDKSATAIQEYSVHITKYLLDRGCKAIVIACNSASAAAGEKLRELFGDQVIIVDVVEPLVEAVVKSQHRKIGIIATKATTDSGIYPRNLKERMPQMEVRTQATPLLAPMIEEGFVSDHIARVVVQEYFKSGQFENIDALLLACTHYPLIKSVVEELLPDTKIMDSTEVTAMALKDALVRNHLLSHEKTQENEFVISDYTETFSKQAKIFFGEEVKLRGEVKV